MEIKLGVRFDNKILKRATRKVALDSPWDVSRTESPPAEQNRQRNTKHYSRFNKRQDFVIKSDSR